MRTHLALVTLTATLANACGDSTAPPPPPPPAPIPLYYLKAPTNSGDNQIDTVYATLALPFRVLVRRGDTPAESVAVLWEMGGDTLAGIPFVSGTSLTDATGIAASPFKLRLGPWTGTYAMRASVPGVVKPGPISIGLGTLCGYALCFTATALAGAPKRFESVSGDGQTRPINTPLAADYVVRLTDSYGNGVGGVVIDWAVTTGGGTITPAQSTTELWTGEAHARATLGPGDGPQIVTATANALASLAPLTFTATAFTPAPPADINGIWDWTELYPTSTCADTGSYIFIQTGSVFSGSSQQVGMCYTSSGQHDNTTGPDPLVNGFVAGDSITFLVPVPNGSCSYYATVSGNAADTLSGTTECRNTAGTAHSSGTWHAVREKQVASVTVTPANPTVVVSASLQLAAALSDASGHRLFFRPITWSSDSPAVATVSSSGVVTAVATGSAIITASAGGQSGAVTVLVP